jgi:hypothetical protein
VRGGDRNKQSVRAIEIYAEATTARPEADQMSDSPESVVHKFSAAWTDSKADELANFFDDDAVRVDGPQGVRRGAQGPHPIRQLKVEGPALGGTFHKRQVV